MSNIDDVGEDEVLSAYTEEEVSVHHSQRIDSRAQCLGDEHSESHISHQDNQSLFSQEQGSLQSVASLDDDDDDGFSLFGETQNDARYVGFDTRLLRFGGKNEDCFKHYEPDVSRGTPGDWIEIPQIGRGEVVPARSLVFNVPMDMFRRDATMFRHMQMWPVSPLRSKACAALLSVLFEGAYLGVPSGDHDNVPDEDQDESEDRGADGNGANNNSSDGDKKKNKSIKEVKRYFKPVRTADHNRYDVMPMFQTMVEELLCPDHRTVVGLRVWIHVFDPKHSHSHLLSKVMNHARALRTTQSSAAQVSAHRNRDDAAELQRHEKAGAGIGELDCRFEDTIGFQYKRIFSPEAWKMWLHHHGCNNVRPCCDNLELHASGIPGRANLFGDKFNGLGGTHPLAPEFLLNGKRAEALAFGLVSQNGEPIDVCREQLSVDSYWSDSSPIERRKFFRTPTIRGRENGLMYLWNTSENRKTIMNATLPNPVLGNVQPGDNLTRVFLEVMIRKDYERQTETEAGLRRYDQGGDADAHELRACKAAEIGQLWAPDHVVTEKDRINVRGFAMQKAVDTMRQEASVQAATYVHDLPSEILQTAETLSGTPSRDSDGVYTIRVKKATDFVRECANRLEGEVVSYWHDLHTRSHERLRNLREVRRTAPGAPFLSPSGSDDAGEHDENYEDVEEDGDEPVPLTTESVGTQRNGMWLKKTYYQVKKELTEFFLKQLEACFVNSRDERTLPRGWVAMYNGLQDGLSKNGNSASMAFRGTHRRGSVATMPGNELNSKDRTVWGNLMMWLQSMWTDVCLIDGRDHRVMFATLLTMFEPYTDQTQMLIYASSRGMGKSVRFERMAELMPKGWTTFSSANSARAGMNSNMSPTNGKVVIADEMISDLTKPFCDERMEYYKTILNKREVELERTSTVKKADGTEEHATYKIVADHHEAYIIATNMGALFTTGDQEPTSGKFALAQRTHCYQARKETNRHSPDADFKQALQAFGVMVEDFRLLVSVAGMVRFAIMKMPWLFPDLSLAERIFEAGDRMLQDEYGLPRPEPRRVQKRSQDLVTMCVLESVAKVYLFKQTAVNYEFGFACAKEGNESCAPEFKIEHLWDVIRSIHPTPEIVQAAWSNALEHSIATSTHGINLMTALAHKAGFKTGLAEFTYLTPEDPDAATEMKALRNIAQGETALDTIWTGIQHTDLQQAEGAPAQNEYRGILQVEDVKKKAASMKDERTARNEFRLAALGAQISEVNLPIDAARKALDYTKRTEDEKRRILNAVFPSVGEATLHYKSDAIIAWALGQGVPWKSGRTIGSKSELLADGVSDAMHFKEVGDESSGGSKRYDFAWNVVLPEKNKDGVQTPWTVVASALENLEPCNRFDMHRAGIIDGLIMLASTDNERVLPMMPALHANMAPGQAFVDKDGTTFGSQSTGMEEVHVRPISCSEFVTEGGHRFPLDGPHPAHKTLHDGTNNAPPKPGTRVEVDAKEVSDPRLTHRRNQRIHEHLDYMVGRGRLPALTSYVSTRMTRATPLVRDMRGVYVNTVCMKEHLSMVFEASLNCSRIPGLINRQEHLANDKKMPSGLSSQGNVVSSPVCSEGVPKSLVRLSHSHDVVPISWTVDFAERFYDPRMADEIKIMNDIIQSVADDQGLESYQIKPKDIPEQTLIFNGYNVHNLNRESKSNEQMMLLSVPVKETGPRHDEKEVQSDAKVSRDALRPAASRAMGHAASNAEVDNYRRSLSGFRHMWGVEGDIFSYETYRLHCAASMRSRGFTYCIEVGTNMMTEQDRDRGLEMNLNPHLMLNARLVEWATREKLYQPAINAGTRILCSTYQRVDENNEGDQDVDMLANARQAMRAQRAKRAREEEDHANRAQATRLSALSGPGIANKLSDRGKRRTP